MLPANATGRYGVSNQITLKLVLGSEEASDSGARRSPVTLHNVPINEQTISKPLMVRNVDMPPSSCRRLAVAWRKTNIYKSDGKIYSKIVTWETLEERCYFILRMDFRYSLGMG